jgi:amino acid transporter
MSRQSAQLARDIGFYGFAFIVLNGMIGAGIFALPSRIAANAGVLSPWLFLAVGALFILLVLSFAELASYFRETGGQVLYVNYAFGRVAGFSTGWLLYLSKIMAFAANVNVMATYLALLVPWVGTAIGKIVLLAGFCGFLTVANVLGVKDGVRTMGVLTVFKLAPLLLLIVLGSKYVNGEVLIPADFPIIEHFGATILLIVYAFLGFESSLVTAGETARPRRNIPRALIVTIAATALFYFLITLVYIAVLPQGGTDKSTLVDLGRTLAGPVGAVLITLAAVFSVASNLSVSVITTPRLTLAMAEHDTLPAWFGRIHERYATPHNSIIFYGVVVFIFAVSSSFAMLAIAASLSRVLTYLACVVALPIVRRKSSAEMAKHAFRLPFGYTIPLIGALICIWMVAQAELESWRMLGALLVVGLGLYAIARWSIAADDSTGPDQAS